MTRIFISHSHSDKAIAFTLFSFLIAALRVEEEAILCTSNPDQGLSYSSNSITDQLKDQLKTAEAIIILITADSLHSAWIPFEAGSFWTTDKPIIPILGPGLSQNDLPGPLRNFLSIAISQSDFADKLNSAINQLAEKLTIQQRFTSRRNHTLQEFVQKLTNWTSRYPNSKASQQEIEELTKQLEEIKTASQQEKEQIEQSYQARIQELQQTNQEQQQQEQSLQSQIQQLDEELQQAKSSLLQQQLTEQSLQSRIQELEQLQPTNVVSVPQIVSETEEVELRSERGVNYTKLHDLLKQQQWQAADEETTRVMLQAAKRENSYLRTEDIKNFPCDDLRTINNLWLRYSDGKFGFSVQREIYESLGGTADFEWEIWELFGDRIGWRINGRWINEEDIIYQLMNAPPGHLPILTSKMRTIEYIYFYYSYFCAQKLVTCNI
ncbi:MAG: GUN4 domain-containing protein [Cyanobacteria bacterium J06631_2]